MFHYAGEFNKPSPDFIEGKKEKSEVRIFKFAIRNPQFEIASLCSMPYALSLSQKTPNRTCVQLGVMTNKVTLYVTLTL
ncbi:MAG: hypothetical protein C0610_05925 [Desulfobacteraceae bacterium]|nr:MAG: hypothetical protein C0610_05925 [Desulfobacteraceae bacterium]